MMVVMTPVVVTMSMSMMTVTIARFTTAFFGSHAPEAMAAPCPFLALFAAVFRPPASSTFGELASKLLPLSALPICALSDASSILVFAAQVSHHDASPVLHITLLLGVGVV
jgi:hypothetical protein